MRGRAGILAFACLMLGGCAGTPTGDSIHGDSNSPGSAQGPAQVSYAIDEDVRLSPGLRQDFERAVELLRAGESEKGIELLTRLTQHPTAGNNTAPYIDLAIAYHRIGRLAEAEESIEAALRINPQHPVANNQYGLILRKTGRFAEAKRAYEAALHRYPEFLPARRNLGILCDLYLGDYECALENYRIYSAIKSDDSSMDIWIADVEQRMAQRVTTR